ncbi:MAG: hypothetical protein WBV87_14880, partial [Candidatus Acidiferrales bacterium]
GHSNPAPWGGLEGKKTSGRRRSVFFLTPFIELIRQVEFVGEKCKMCHTRKPHGALGNTSGGGSGGCSVRCGSNSDAFN